MQFQSSHGRVMTLKRSCNKSVKNVRPGALHSEASEYSFSDRSKSRFERSHFFSLYALLTQLTVESPQEAFARAEQLYQEQRYDEVAEVYASMRTAGIEDAGLSACRC